MSHHKNTDQILGFAFGEVLIENGCVLVDFFVRTSSGQSEVEGKRGGLIVHRSILEQILGAKEAMFSAMAEAGADRDIVPPVRMTIPSWDQGPTLRSVDGQVALCQAFGITEVVPEAGAVAAVMEVADLAPGAPAFHGEYLIPYGVLMSLTNAIPQVLRKFDAAPPARRKH